MSNEQESPETEIEVDLENQEQAVEDDSEETVESEAETDVEAEVETEEVSIEDLQNKLTLAEQKGAESLDKALRVQAEMENLKRRTSKDLENAHKYALEGFSKELLAVIDSLELGLQAVTGDSKEVQKFREGSELTLKQFDVAFAKFNIEKIDPTGEVFNPELHQAMAMQPSEDTEPNTILNVFQKGYSLNGRLIRPAMVVVAKAP